MDREDVMIGFAQGGMAGHLDPSGIGPGSFARGVNIQIKNQTIATRPGVRVIPCIAEDESAEEFKDLNIQGAKYYNPSRGLGLLQLSENTSSYVMVAAGGRKFSLFLQESGGEHRFVVSDRTVVDPGRSDLQLVWWEQAENYAIASDGFGDVWFWDGADVARYSVGYNPQAAEEDSDITSEIPSGTSALVYSNGRLWVVVNARQILAGDIVHGVNQTSAEDVIKFTEQGYFAEGQYFLPPTAMGDIVAASILPIQDTAQGQGEVMFHTADGGIFSINTNVYPRTSWSDTPMVRVFLLRVSATGPYAVDAWNGDQYYRTDYGIQSMRSARADAGVLGSPHRPLSEGVNTWLGRDYHPYLRFCSLATWHDRERILCTTQPETDLAHRCHRGLVSLNLDPVDLSAPTPAWEGLWTFPPEIKSPIQLINGKFGSDERMLMLARGADKLNRAADFDTELKWDILEDSSVSLIRSQVITREVSGGSLLRCKEWVGGRIYFRNSCGPLTWKVEVRTESQGWKVWREGEIERTEAECPTLCELREKAPIHAEFELGKPPYRRSRKLQARVTWTGYSELELLKVRWGEAASDSRFEKDSLTKVTEAYVGCDEEDFAYSEG